MINDIIYRINSHLEKEEKHDKYYLVIPSTVYGRLIDDNIIKKIKKIYKRKNWLIEIDPIIRGNFIARYNIILIPL